MQHLLELGGDFTFVGRQRCFRIGDEWYCADLLFCHRVLRHSVVIDLKLGKITSVDCLSDKVLAAEDRLALPDEKTLVAEHNNPDAV